MKTNNSTFTLFLLTATILLTACAHKTSVIAKRNPAYSPSLADRIAITERSIRNPETDALKQAVTVELARRGAKVVPTPESEFALGCWVDESWESVGPAVRTIMASQRNIDLRNRPASYDTPMPVQVQVPRNTEYTKGIRLRLFVTRPKNTNRVETAWEGYIAGGPRLSPKQYKPLLRTLLDYFGKDYVGNVKLVE
jgi:hypothetical protein